MGGGWRRCKQHIKHMFLDLLQLLRRFCTEKIIKNKHTNKQEWSSTEEASNESVAKNFWRQLLSNPDRHIYIYYFELPYLRNDILWGSKWLLQPGDKKPQNGSSWPLPAPHYLSISTPQRLYGMW